jgi:predicted DNA-binding WGR domain protein
VRFVSHGLNCSFVSLCKAWIEDDDDIKDANDDGDDDGKYDSRQSGKSGQTKVTIGDDVKNVEQRSRKLSNRRQTSGLVDKAWIENIDEDDNGVFKDGDDDNSQQSDKSGQTKVTIGDDVKNVEQRSRKLSNRRQTSGLVDKAWIEDIDEDDNDVIKDGDYDDGEYNSRQSYKSGQTKVTIGDDVKNMKQRSRKLSNRRQTPGDYVGKVWIEDDDEGDVDDEYDNKFVGDGGSRLSGDNLLPRITEEDEENLQKYEKGNKEGKTSRDNPSREELPRDVARDSRDQGLYGAKPGEKQTPQTSGECQGQADHVEK